MKILIVMNEYHSTSNGLSISTQRFVKEFKDLGHEVRVLARGLEGEVDYPLNEYKVPILNRLIKKQGFSFVEIDKKIIKEAIKWADVVHLEDPFFLCSYAGKLANKYSKVCTGTYHVYPENMTYSVKLGKIKPLNMIFMRMFYKLVYRHCSHIQCPTNLVKERLKRYGYKGKLYVISNGILEEDIVKHIDNLENDKFNILSIGRYSAEKGQEILFKAIKLSKYNDKIQLILAGKGPLENKFIKLGEELKNKPILKFMTKEELKHTRSFSDLYIHCAEIEVEGMACMESFASGVVPLIANSRLSSTKAYALTKNNLFKEKDAEDLKNKIEYWIENPEERNKMREEYIKFAQKFSIKECAKQVMEMFEDALTKNRK